MHSLADTLAAGPVVIDGGLGTLLEQHGHDLSSTLWSARLLADDPAAIRRAHREFFEAGARVAITSSYQVGYDAMEAAGFDREGVLHDGLTGLSEAKRWFAEHGNRDGRTGGIHDAIKRSDLLLGLSGPGIVEPWMLTDMADDAIVFAMANPTPEVMPELMPPNVSVIATGRSDYPNQINNVLAFPGVFRGMLDVNATRCTIEMKRAAADALADLVEPPTPARIIPGAFETGVAEAVAAAVSNTAVEQGYVRG